MKTAPTVFTVSLILVILLGGFGCDSTDGEFVGKRRDPASTPSLVNPSPPASVDREGVVFTRSDELLRGALTSVVVVEDVNLDAHADLITVEGDATVVRSNRGNAIFTDSEQDLEDEIPTRPTSLALGDLDNDGDPDLVAALGDLPTRILFNNGTEAFFDSGQRLGDTFTNAVAIGDLDGGGFADLVTGNDGPNRVLFNDGSGHFPIVSDSLGSSITKDIAIDDLDGDGDGDVVAGNAGLSFIGSVGFEPERTWLLGTIDVAGFVEPAGGQFMLNQNLGQSETQDIALADLDGNGTLDLVAGAIGPNRVWFNDGLGTFLSSEQLLGGAGTHAVELGDIDLDGDTDIAEASELGIQLWFNDGEGFFTAAAPFGDPAFSLALGDLDRDGDLEVIAGLAAGTQIWFNGRR